MNTFFPCSYLKSPFPATWSSWRPPAAPRYAKKSSSMESSDPICSNWQKVYPCYFFLPSKNTVCEHFSFFASGRYNCTSHLPNKKPCIHFPESVVPFQTRLLESFLSLPSMAANLTLRTVGSGLKKTKNQTRRD